MHEIFDSLFGPDSEHRAPYTPPRYALTPVGAALMRRWYVDNVFRPIATFALTRAPELGSMAFLIAQFFDGGAADEVHMDYLYSVLPTPDFRAAGLGGSGVFRDDGRGPWEEDPVNLPGFGDRDTFEDGFLPAPGQRPALPPWNGSLDAVSAFSAFCVDEDLDPCSASYTPYVVFRRAEVGIEEEIVGHPHRPWLDGIAPESRPELTPHDPLVERRPLDVDALLGQLGALYETLGDLATGPCTHGSEGAELLLLRSTLDQLLAWSAGCRDMLSER